MSEAVPNAGSTMTSSPRPDVISADDHVVEHPTTWTDRMDAKRWGDRIPTFVPAATQADSDSWRFDREVRPLHSAVSVGAVLGDRAAPARRWGEIDMMAWDADARARAMDIDGVATSVLYPSVAGASGEHLAAISDPELERDCCAAYNDYIAEEWLTRGSRYVGQCVIPLGDVDMAVAELRRAATLGHKGVTMSANPTLVRGDLPHLNEKHWDPIWRTCVELDFPVSFHAGAIDQTQFPPYSGYAPPVQAAMRAMTGPVSSTFLLGNLLYSGILVRFPALMVVFSGTTFAWISYTIESAEHQFHVQRYDKAGWEISPTEQFRRQIFVVGWYDRSGIQLRDYIGVENMLWSTKFPEATSTWPRTQETVDRCFAGVSNEDRRLILGENTRRLYRLK